MRIKGIDLNKPNNVIIPVIRGDTEVIFQAACILDFKEFEQVLKEPTPPMILHKGKTVAVPDFEDRKYNDQLVDYSSKRFAWLIAKSLTATEGLEWDKVDFSNPDSWENYKTELKDLGFNEFQVSRLVNGVMEANGLSDARVKEARDRFLAGQLAQQ
jgi:hypothetical protein